MMSNQITVTPTQAQPARCPFLTIATKCEWPIRRESQAWVPGAAAQHSGTTEFENLS